ncbi:MAG: DUF2752 domain-containing protein [Muribaculaceae bacterium]|nr:DUF2752 domain-containing protein [Muribaculaceae bacterium]
MTKRTAVVIFAAIACGAGIMASVDPTGAWGRWLPKCPLHALTGYDCPGCGTTRAVHALMHGEPLRALSFNLFLPVATIMIVLSAMAEIAPARFPKLRATLMQPTVLYSFAAMTIFWWIIRNIIGI